MVDYIINNKSQLLFIEPLLLVFFVFVGLFFSLDILDDLF